MTGGQDVGQRIAVELDSLPVERARAAEVSAATHATNRAARRISRVMSASAWLVFAAALACSLSVYVWGVAFMRRATSVDDAYIAAFALRMIDGSWLPFVDAVSHRGPFLYWYAAVFQWIFGPYSWVGLRVAILLAGTACVVACFMAGRAARMPLAGAIGAFTYAFLDCIVYNIGAGASINGEPVAAPIGAVGFAFAAWGLMRAERARSRHLLVFAGGFFTALAALTKQTSLLLLGPLLLWTLSVGWTENASSSWRNRLSPSLVLLCGWTLPFIVVLLRYAAAGELHSLFYWTVGYNANIYMRPYRGAPNYDHVTHFLLDLDTRGLISFAIVLTLLAGIARAFGEFRSFRPAALLESYAGVGFEATVALAALVTFVSAVAPLRMWPHYFIVAIPWFGLLAGVWIERLLRLGTQKGRAAAHAVFAVGMAAFAGVAVQRELSIYEAGRQAGGWQHSGADKVCGFIDQHSLLADTIFVWGFDAELYIACRRRPATRFVFTSMLAGSAPPNWSAIDPALIAPGAPEIAAAEIEQNKPAVIVDHAAMFGGQSVTQARVIGDVVRRDYCLVKNENERGRYVGLYVRRDSGHCGT